MYHHLATQVKSRNSSLVFPFCLLSICLSIPFLLGFFFVEKNAVCHLSWLLFRELSECQVSHFTLLSRAGLQKS